MDALERATCTGKARNRAKDARNRAKDVLKFLLLNLGPDWPDLGRDFLFGDFILFLDRFWPNPSFGRLLPIKGKV